MGKQSKKDLEIESLKRANSRYKTMVARNRAYAQARKDLIAQGYKPS